jgi:hypothetical protein
MSKGAIKNSAPGAVSKAEPEPEPPASEEDIANLGDLIQNAWAGDTTAITELAAGKVGQVLVNSLGSPAEWLRQSLVVQASEGNLLVQEAMRRKIDAVRADLEGPNPTVIEQLLAERASLCWFMANWHESVFTNAGSLPEHQVELHQLRIDRAHARFLSAVRTLAQVRKLAVPTLQVNIAKNQVNVAGGGS